MKDFEKTNDYKLIFENYLLTDNTLPVIAATIKNAALTVGQKSAPAPSTKQFDPNQFPPHTPIQRGKEGWLTKGGKDNSPTDDVVPVTEFNDKASSVKPSQSEIFLGKSLGMAVGGVGADPEDNDLQAIISSDMRILDGHHRWAATMFNGGGNLQGKKADLTIDKLIPVLRAAGIAYGEEGRGEPTGGDVNIYQATREHVVATLDNMANKEPTKYVKKGQTKEWVANLAEKGGYGGPDYEMGLDIILEVLTDIQTNYQPQEGALKRTEMPVLEPDTGDAASGKNEVDDVSKKLNAGEIDVYSPYANWMTQGQAKQTRYLSTGKSTT